MSSRQRLFRVFYRLGFTPWDGHPLATSLRGLVEGDGALTPGTALDIGCGTGDNALYLAGLGWDVTGIDYVAKAVEKARAKAAKRDAAAPGSVRFDQADATFRRASDGDRAAIAPALAQFTALLQARPGDPRLMAYP